MIDLSPLLEKDYDFATFIIKNRQPVHFGIEDTVTVEKTEVRLLQHNVPIELPGEPVRNATVLQIIDRSDIAGLNTVKYTLIDTNIPPGLILSKKGQA